MELLQYALYFGLLFITFQLIVFIRNTGDLPTLPSTYSENKLSISILIPARNEEKSIHKSLTSAVSQRYPNFEVIILDDNSTDRTPEIINQIRNDNPDSHLVVLKGKAKPENWLGKNWACHQLSEVATGKVLVFIDADTQLEPGFLESINSAIANYELDALTVWPHQLLESFWERMVIPQMYYVIYTLLPIKYTYSDPVWMPKTLIPKFRASFAAACGQCMVFTRKSYNTVGGHANVKDQVVEDVQLARHIRANNFNFKMFHGNNTIHCRMYSNEPEIVAGFRKNFLAGFDNNIPFFLFSWLLHLTGYILPWLAFVLGILFSDTSIILLSGIMIVIPICIRILMDSQNRWNTTLSLLHIVGVLWFNRLATLVLFDRLTGRKSTWKNRTV